MIIKGQFTEKLRKSSQRYYYLFNTLNGLSFMCVGETVIILLALKLNCPDYVISAIGALVFWSCLLLPAGKLLAARVGAAPSQAIFWFLRNIAAIVMASAILWENNGHHGMAVAVLLGCAFLFYGFRAAGVVMIHPLIGNITTPSERSTFYSINGILFYSACLVALLIITGILHFNDSVWRLGTIIVTGSIIGCISSYFIKNIHETGELKKAAQIPLLSNAKIALKNTSIRRQIVAFTVNNMAFSMVLPISMLTIKRGYGLTDKAALLYSIVQLVGSIVFSKLYQPIVKQVGPRKSLLGCQIGLMLTCIIWVFSPKDACALFLIPLFIIVGGLAMACPNIQGQYFLQTVPVSMQVTGSIFIMGLASFLGGALSTLVSGAILKALEYFLGKDISIGRYHIYYAIAFVILTPCYWLMKRLRKVKEQA